MRTRDRKVTARHESHTRRDAGDAFLKDPTGGRARAFAKDDLAESLAESFLDSATSADPRFVEDTLFTEELGGPFLTTEARRGTGRHLDRATPMDDQPESWPKVMSALISSDEEESESAEGETEAEREPSK